MSLLIDGYNLLHAAGIFPPDNAAGTLANARAALVDFLSRSLAPEVLQRTIIVFDARHAPPGLPRIVERGGVTMLFAPRHQSADETLAELIQQDHSPRHLTVVSSDHQVQRAAKRRRARAVDSDRWAHEIQHAKQAADADSAGAESLKPELLTEGEVAYWVERFQRPRDD